MISIVYFGIAMFQVEAKKHPAMKHFSTAIKLRIRAFQCLDGFTGFPDDTYTTIARCERRVKNEMVKLLQKTI